MRMNTAGSYFRICTRKLDIEGCVRKDKSDYEQKTTLYQRNKRDYLMRMTELYQHFKRVI